MINNYWFWVSFFCNVECAKQFSFIFDNFILAVELYSICTWAFCQYDHFILEVGTLYHIRVQTFCQNDNFIIEVGTPVPVSMFEFCQSVDVLRIFIYRYIWKPSMILSTAANLCPKIQRDLVAVGSKDWCLCFLHGVSFVIYKL